jgi:hypothetical protein
VTNLRARIFYTFLPEEGLPLSIEQEAGSVAEPVWKLLKREKSSSAGNRILAEQLTACDYTYRDIPIALLPNRGIDFD